MKNSIKWLGVAVALVLLAAASVAGAEETPWQKSHPRRAEVNGRLGNQNKRIDQGVKNGSLSKDQARQLHQDDKSIRKEERADAAANGGHITKAQQRALNRQENQNSRQIRKEKHPLVTP